MNPLSRIGERQSKSYLKAGILLDEISNYCMISGIQAWKKEGTPHAGMNGFCQEGTCACMCMNGQPRLASILLLDLAAEARIRISYAGDFDPEGLLIAKKVI